MSRQKSQRADSQKICRYTPRCTMEALCSVSLSLFSTVLSLPNNEWSWRILRNLLVCYSDKRMRIVCVCVCSVWVCVRARAFVRVRVVPRIMWNTVDNLWWRCEALSFALAGNCCHLLQHHSILALKHSASPPWGTYQSADWNDHVVACSEGHVSMTREVWVGRAHTWCSRCILNQTYVSLLTKPMALLVVVATLQHTRRSSCSEY